MSETIPTKPFDIRRAWNQTEKALRRMSREERGQTLVNAGILTAKGAVTKPYAGLFVSLK
jgi:DNA/RNA endonuclease G (NUC1)